MSVYIIYNLSNECYIGSTTQDLKKRWQQHKSDYKRWKAGKRKKCNSFELFDKYGIGNCFYELLETVQDESQLKFKERYWIKFYDDNCVNKVSRPIITEEEWKEQKKEYYKNNKEQLLKQMKEYRENNKEQLLKQRKEYRENNREQITKQKKEYYENNREQIAKRMKEYSKNNREQIAKRMKEYCKKKYTCECGSTLRKHHKSRHERTAKHQSFLQTKE